MDHEFLKEMEKALRENKTLETLTLSATAPLPNAFCHHVLFGIRCNTSLSKVYLNFQQPINWDCPNDGRLLYVSHMLCDSVGCSV